MNYLVERKTYQISYNKNGQRFQYNLTGTGNDLNLELLGRRLQGCKDIKVEEIK
ncbi:MAG: hypothetical protein ACFFAU_01245 [Candidatus Hodarchaeota archaeon]